MKTLHLTLSKKWFDLIASGEKKEEYRDLKSYWHSRLANNGVYDAVFFRNGYTSNAPRLTVELKDIAIGVGYSKWGAPDYPVYILKLGKVLDQTSTTKDVLPVKA